MVKGMVTYKIATLVNDIWHVKSMGKGHFND